jgi:hypothetical protein
MTIAELLQVISQILFLGLCVVTTAQAVRRPARATLVARRTGGGTPTTSTP